MYWTKPAVIVRTFSTKEGNSSKQGGAASPSLLGGVPSGQRALPSGQRAPGERLRRAERLFGNRPVQPAQNQFGQPVQQQNNQHNNLNDQYGDAAASVAPQGNNQNGQYGGAAASVAPQGN